MITVPEALLLMNFVLEKGRERHYTYYFVECGKSIISAVASKQLMKDEVWTSVLGLIYNLNCCFQTINEG